MMTEHAYAVEPAETNALMRQLCGDLLDEADPAIRYSLLTAEQARYAALVSAIKAARGQAIGEMRRAGHSWQEIAEITGLGTYQRAQQLAAAG